MHLYSLGSYKALVCILYKLMWLQTVQQTLQHQTFDEDSSNRQDVATNNRTFTGPLIVLMSSDTVSIAQLPMMLNGDLTEVYTLANEQQHEDDSFGRDDGEKEDSRSGEDDGDDLGVQGAQHGNVHDADGRESEQMPHMMSVNTTTSLGKSEWQQIAVGARDREEVSLAEQAGRKDARDGPTTGGAKEDGQEEEGRQLVRQPRTSNSARDHDDSSNSGLVVSNEASHASQREENHINLDQNTARRAQESRMQNVTSAVAGPAQSNNDNIIGQQQQPPSNLASMAKFAPAEDDDKTGRASSSFLRMGPASPSDTSSFESVASSSSNRVHFSDLDVHMSFGYAFVADSAGRIHRFRLPVGPKSSRAAARKSSTSGNSSNRAKSTVSTGECATIDCDAISNALDAGGDLKFASHQPAKLVNATNDHANSADASNNVQPNADRRDGAGYDTVEGYTNRLAHNVHDVNKARQRSGIVEGQSENESQHPAISGEQNEPSDSTRSDSLVSGTSQPEANHDHQAQRFNFRVRNLAQSDDVKPRIIWSRSKKERRLNLRGSEAVVLYPAKQSDKQQLADAGGALSQHEKIIQKPGAGLTTTRQYSDAQLGSDETQLESGGHETGNEIKIEHQQQVDSGAKSGPHKRPQLDARTEVAVDWLNNLLFVLDKCRLLVMDFDGNNELVLIDDFNANNRPVDIKVDPINGFLFWLQVGKFHNTIYRLDLNLLTMPRATQNLVSNALRLRQCAQNNATNSDNSVTFDASDLVSLVSHQYAHPIITNLPRNTRIFTIDHKHSRIYVPLSPPLVTSSTIAHGANQQWSDSATSDDSQAKHDDTEIFASNDDVTHLNSSQPGSVYRTNSDCDTNGTSSTEGQILAYNLDGTDAGPLRTLGEKSHINSLDGMQDLALNSEDSLLYWLTNEGRDFFEEFRENSTIQPAQHYLNGKSYSKLTYFDDNNSNQPTDQKSRFNVRKIIHLLASSISSNRQIRRTEYDELNGTVIRNSEIDVTRNAPYIILGVTCLVVITVYLVYALIFQRIQAQPRPQGHNNDHCGGESMNCELSIGSGSNGDDNSNGFVNSTTISRWVAGPSVPGTDTSTFDRDINSFNGRLGAYDLESTNYNRSNAVDEHYRGSTLDQIDGQLTHSPAASRLANLSEWPSNMHDLSNKLYVPVEVLQDEALSSIRRVSIDQLEIESKAPLGQGHFGTVLQGTIDCTNYQFDCRQSIVLPCKAPLSPDSLAPPSRSRTIGPSTPSSGHGSSSTSCDFATANTCTESTSRDDYLTPKNQLSSTASDYVVDMPASTSQLESCSDYCDSRDVRSFRTTAASLVGTKLRVAIKKLKDNASSEEKRDFLQEAKLLANFDHPNIVQLIGICLDRGSTLIVMELMLGGDLIRYMKANKPSSTNNDNLTYDDLLKICLDIANGCCYLEDMDYIHRDLAARNCLVSSRKREERVVKLADFGLARDIYKDSYYKKLNDSFMPLKWMAPECLKEQKFTKKSDVWSFGIVMWEVMSYCREKPYDRVEPFYMKEHLDSGARLRQPDYCDDSMYRLMNQCWQMEPDNRPTFHECRAMLIEIRNLGRL